MIDLEVNGQPYTGFVSASTENRLDALTNTFVFEAAVTRNNPLPFVGNEPCRVLVYGVPVLTGNIEVVEVSYTSTSHSVIYQGRGKTGDLIDSTLNSISDIRAPIGLKEIIQRVLREIELDIEVIENVATDPFNEAEDLAGPDPGENAYSFIEKFARKRQVLLTENGDGNLVITQSSTETINSPLRHVLGSSSNNILSGSASYDYTGRYNLYRFVSSQNPIPLVNAGETDLTSLVNQGDGISDPALRIGRQLVLVAESPYSNAQCKKRSEWEANIRKTRSRVYTCVTDGHLTQQNSLWSTNRKVSIIDNLCGINAEMLVNVVNFSIDQDSGSITTLEFVESNSYTLLLEEPRSDKTGIGFLP